ncbi:hypothetical protein J437_LFUL018189, partial [Ladona fulva]
MQGLKVGEKRPCPLFNVTTEHLGNPEVIKNINLNIPPSRLYLRLHKAQTTCPMPQMSTNRPHPQLLQYCGGPHDSSDCKKSKEDDPKCFNCNLNHPANYRGCKAFISAKQTILHRKKISPSVPNANTNFPPLPTPSYRQAVLSSQPSNLQQPPTSVPPDQPPDSDDLISWTVNIINQTNELTEFFNEWSIKICLLQETFLSRNKNLFIPNYTIIRNDRPTRGGEVAIAISNELAFNILPRIILNVIEYVGVSIICNNETINIFSIYIPPRRKYTGVAFQNDFMKLFQLPGKNLFAGDWNSKHNAWGCKASNPNGNDLLKIINNLNADFHNITFHSPNQPTHTHNATSADLLDFLIATNYHHPISIQAIYDFDSDHLPLIFNLDHAPTSSPIRSTTKINWTKFHEFLQNHIHYIPLLQETTPVHIDAQTKLISDLFASAKICSSKTTSKPNHQNPKLPKHILDLISQRNRHRRHYNTYKNPRDKMFYQLAKNTIRKEIEAYRNNIWNDKL